MSTATPDLRHSLEKRLRNIDLELEAIQNGKSGLTNPKVLERHKRSLESRLGKLTREHIGVSDHAIVRYMERVHGIDINAIKDEIVGCEHTALKLPSGQFGVNGSHTIRVKNGVVVTVVTNEKDRD